MTGPQYTWIERKAYTQRTDNRQSNLSNNIERWENNPMTVARIDYGTLSEADDVAGKKCTISYGGLSHGISTSFYASKNDGSCCRVYHLNSLIACVHWSVVKIAAAVFCLTAAVGLAVRPTCSFCWAPIKARKYFFLNSFRYAGLQCSSRCDCNNNSFPVTQ